MGILPLAVEIGRYTNVDLNDRKCFRCKDSIEDEFHFICNCTLYSDLRSSLFYSIQVEIGNIGTFSPEEKFAKIMNSNSKHLYRYVEEAWKLRKREVFENNVS